ncbi:MAG: hypothetical protein U0746_14525 [Gemmataceae bacterium]
MVFAKETNDALTGLVKKLDAAVAKHKNVHLHSYVVFCNDDKKLPDKLKALAAKERIDRCTLTIDEPAGPEDYKIAKDADVTVVYYVDKTVKVNRAFKKGDLNAKAVDALVTDLAKILPDEKKK